MRSLKPREVLRALKRAGFEEVRSKGSHRILKMADRPGTVAVPFHAGKDVKTGTLRGIITAAGLTVERFWELVDE
jgi:predicted RNA binding protein YcfA (HicA-like mRNA interferase family)